MAQNIAGQPPAVLPGTSGVIAVPVQGVTGGVPQPINGNVGGYTGQSQVIPTVQTTAYSSGQDVGGVLTFSGVVRAGQTTGLAQKALVVFADTQTAVALDLILFSANPTSSTITNGSALSLASADNGKVLGVIHINDCSSGGTPTLCQAQQQAIPFVAATAGGPLYGALVTRAALTLASTADIAVTLSGPQD